MSNQIEQIKELLPINKVLGYYLLGDKNIYGQHKYRCPFHGNGQEKTPSLFANDEKGFFYCFGCKEHGDIFSFVQKYEQDKNLSFYETIEELKELFPEELANVELSNNYQKEDKLYFYKKKILEFHEKINQKMVEDLFLEENKMHLLYLTNERKLDLELIKNFKIGFSKERLIENFANQLLKQEEFKELKKKDIGLFNDKGAFLFSNRIMFPILNNRKKIVGWSGGRIYDDQNPKYINSINSVVYNKSTNLFNIDKVAFSSIDELIICEGNLDSTQLYNYGANNAVSLLGTNLTQHQINLFKNKIKFVTLLLDQDEAGQKAITKISKQLLANGIIPFIMNLGKHKDIDDFLKANPELKGNILNYIKKHKQDILKDYLIEGYIKNEENLSIEKRYYILQTIKEMYEVIEDDIIRVIYKKILDDNKIVFENLEKEYLKKKKIIEKEKRENYKEKDLEEIVELKKSEKMLYILFNLLEKNIEESDISNFLVSKKIKSLKNKIGNIDKFKEKYPEEYSKFSILGDKLISKYI